MKITITCDCGNEVVLNGNHAEFDITKDDFDCYINDDKTNVIIECDKCVANRKLRIGLTDYSIN